MPGGKTTVPAALAEANAVTACVTRAPHVTCTAAVMRDRPLLLILDEPTAALDATTEHALFERYAEASQANRATGTFTLLVTHRFSTVAAADLIVVLEGGRVTEQGTRDDPIAAGGHYAELYRLQAKGYS